MKWKSSKTKKNLKNLIKIIKITNEFLSNLREMQLMKICQEHYSRLRSN